TISRCLTLHRYCRRTFTSLNRIIRPPLDSSTAHESKRGQSPIDLQRRSCLLFDEEAERSPSPAARSCPPADAPPRSLPRRAAAGRLDVAGEAFLARRPETTVPGIARGSQGNPNERARADLRATENSERIPRILSPTIRASRSCHEARPCAAGGW